MRRVVVLGVIALGGWLIGFGSWKATYAAWLYIMLAAYFGPICIRITCGRQDLVLRSITWSMFILLGNQTAGIRWMQAHGFKNLLDVKVLVVAVVWVLVISFFGLHLSRRFVPLRNMKK